MASIKNNGSFGYLLKIADFYFYLASPQAFLFPANYFSSSARASAERIGVLSIGSQWALTVSLKKGKNLTVSRKIK